MGQHNSSYFQADEAQAAMNSLNRTVDEPEPTTLYSCLDTCTYDGDGQCDDGGSGSMYSLCTYGTDCTDCGYRYSSYYRRRYSSYSSYYRRRYYSSTEEAELAEDDHESEEGVQGE